MDNQELYLQELKEQTRYVRVKNRLTIKDISSKSGVSSATISNFENGDKSTTVQSLISMLEVTGHKLIIVEVDK